MLNKISSRYRVYDAPEAYVLWYQGVREAETSDSFDSSGFLGGAYTSWRLRPEMNLDELEALREKGGEADDNDNPAPENSGGGGQL